MRCSLEKLPVSQEKFIAKFLPFAEECTLQIEKMVI